MDKKEFAKMFKISIPVEEYFDYYVETLSRSPEFSHLPELVEGFKAFEKWVTDNGYDHIGKYKKEVLSQLKEEIANTKAYNDFQEFDYSDHKFRTLDERFIKSGKHFISIDIKNANFSTIKTFDKDNELGSSWEDFCKSMIVHPLLIKSKSFRQVVFGNLNPKRNGKIQLMRMNALADTLEEKGFDLAYISNDEVIVATDQPYDDWMVIVKIAEQSKQFAYKGYSGFGGGSMTNVPLKLTNLKWVKVEGMRKGEYLKEFYNDYMHYKHNSLVGVPGNSYYMYFKKYILEEEIEDRDLYFTHESKLAQWIV